jgi:hypothetical protein
MHYLGSVPKEYPRIAQHFSAGNWHLKDPVPKGRLKTGSVSRPFRDSGPFSLFPALKRWAILNNPYGINIRTRCRRLRFFAPG